MYLFVALINVLELTAALAGLHYLKSKPRDQPTRYFVYFLWLTCAVELVFGWFPVLICYRIEFEALQGTILERNHWAYNLYFVLNFTVYTCYLSSTLPYSRTKNVLRWTIVFYTIAAALNLMYSGVFYSSISSFTYISGSILLLWSVVLYFMNILQSDEILNFQRSIVFYIAAAALVFHLSVTPLFIYSEYYNTAKSPEFVKVRSILLNLANVVLYGCYILGFMICSKTNKYS